jgi:hypothetical protein
MNAVNWTIDNWDKIVAAIAAVVFAARLIVMLTPTPKDDTALEYVVEWLKRFGLSIPEPKKTVGELVSKTPNVAPCMALGAFLALSACTTLQVQKTIGYIDQLFTAANAIWTKVNVTVTKAEFEAYLKLFGVTDPDAIAHIEKIIGFTGGSLTLTSEIASKVDAYLNGK